MEKKWNEAEMEGYRLIHNEGGKDLGISSGSKVTIITEDGFASRIFSEQASWRPMRTGDCPQQSGRWTWLPGFRSKILPA